MPDNASREEKIAEIRHRYLRIDMRYDQNVFPPPFFVEISGMTSAGKTTSAEGIYSLLWKYELRTDFQQEGAQKFRDTPRHTPDYNFRTGIYVVENVIREFYRHSYDVVLLDRGIFDTFCWMEWWLRKGKLDAVAANYSQKFFLQQAPKIDAAFFLVCDPEVAARRQAKKSRSMKPGAHSSGETLKILHDIYTKSYEALHKQYPQLQLVDTTTLDVEAMVDLILEKTLAALCEKASCSRGEGCI